MRTQKRILFRALLGLLALAMLAPRAAAEDWQIIGSRYQAMGGAGVATVNDSNAAHWNPGALAFADHYEVELPVNLTVLTAGDAIRDADEIIEFIQANSFDAVLTKIQTGGVLTPAELQDTLSVAENLLELGNSNEGFVTDFDAGFRLYRQGMVLTMRTAGSFGLDPELDLGGFSFSDGLTAAAQVANVVGSGTDRTGQFTNPSSQGLADLIAAGFAWTPDQAEELVFQSELAGLDTSSPTIQDLLSNVAGSTGGLTARDLAQSLTGVTTNALMTAEVGLGYGVPLFGERLGIGGNLRMIQGITYTRFLQFDDIQSSEDLIDDLLDSNNRATSQQAALDLGVLLRPTRWLRIGAVGRNLNGLSFDLDGPGEVVVDPQVRAGIAVYPVPFWVIAADVDITENASTTLVGRTSRMLSLGTELLLPLWRSGLALRAGAYKNLASDENVITLTAGLGLRAGHLGFAVAAAAATSRAELEVAGGRELPSRVQFSASLKWVSEF